MQNHRATEGEPQTTSDQPWPLLPDLVQGAYRPRSREHRIHDRFLSRATFAVAEPATIDSITARSKAAHREALSASVHPHDYRGPTTS